MDETNDDRAAGWQRLHSTGESVPPATPAPTGENVPKRSRRPFTITARDLIKAMGVGGPSPSRREARFGGALHSKHDDVLPADAEELRRAGGMRWLEWAAGERAKEESIKFEREFWLPTLERWLESADRDFEGEEIEWVRSDLRREIKRLRRCLGLTQSPEERRERTRQRVRAYRARKAVRR